MPRPDVIAVRAALLAAMLLFTGAADPALVKKLAVELYLEPKRAPDLTSGRLRLTRLTRRWVVRGAFGRSTEKHARRALDAAGKLDVDAVLAAYPRQRAPKELAPVSSDEIATR